MKVYKYTIPNAVTEVTFSGMEDLVPENSPYRDFYEKGCLYPYKDGEITVSYLTYHQKKSDFCHARMLYHGALCLSPWLKERHPAFFQRILEESERHIICPSTEGDFVLAQFPVLEDAICPSACRLTYGSYTSGFCVQHIAIKQEKIPSFGLFELPNVADYFTNKLYIVDTGTEDSFYHYITTHNVTGIELRPMEVPSALSSRTCEILPLGHPDPRPVIFVPQALPTDH